jgi:hypothetical protein
MLPWSSGAAPLTCSASPLRLDPCSLENRTEPATTLPPRNIKSLQNRNLDAGRQSGTWNKCHAENSPLPPLKPAPNRPPLCPAALRLQPPEPPPTLHPCLARSFTQLLATPSKSTIWLMETPIQSQLPGTMTNSHRTPADPSGSANRPTQNVISFLSLLRRIPAR